MTEPHRQSPLHQRHLQAGAHLETISGWQLPARYALEPMQELAWVRGAVGVSDASALTKLDLRGSASELRLEKPARLWVLTPNHALITAPGSFSFIPSASVTDVSSVLSAVLLAGPLSRQVLAKLTTLNVGEAAMPNGAARQARMAHVNATMLRVDSAGVPGFLLLVTRDLAEHIWDALLEAGKELGAAPFGVIAQGKWLGAQ